MTTLSETQTLVLTAAVRHPERRLLPLPERLKGGAAAKVLDALAEKGLIVETEAKPGDAIWRKTKGDQGVTLVATDAAFAALSMVPGGANEADTAPTVDDGGDGAVAGTYPAQAAMPAPAAPGRKLRANSKQAQVVDMLRRPEGATIAEIATLTGWQSHTVRGALAGAIKKTLGLTVISEKTADRGRVYRIPG